MPRAPKMEGYAPKYETSESAQFYIQKFEGLSNINQWTEEQKCIQLCIALPKEAEAWFMNLKPEVKNNFEQLKQAFVTRFGNIENRANLFKKYVNAEQGLDSVQNYVESITSLGRDLDKSDEDIMDKIIHGLNNDIRSHVMMKEPQSIEELVKYAKMAESVEGNSQNKRTYRNNNVTINQSEASRPFRGREMTDRPYWRWDKTANIQQHNLE